MNLDEYTNDDESDYRYLGQKLHDEILTVIEGQDAACTMAALGVALMSVFYNVTPNAREHIRMAEAFNIYLNSLINKTVEHYEKKG